MIDEQRTLEIYGYTSDMLSPKSHKYIIKVCDECGKYQIIKKCLYNSNLCASCNKKGKNNPNYKNKIILICAICGEKFKVIPARSEAKFCSQKCAGKSHSKNYIGENNPNFGKFGKDNSNYKEKITIKCAYCGKLKNIYPSFKREYNFCNHKCHGKWQSKNLKGKNSPMFGKNKGSNNGNWLGGISFNKYCNKFNESLKTKIRNKYNNCDYISGIHTDVCNKGKNLSVHHVNYDKQCGCNGNKCKLIPLSKINHNYTNFNRSFWNRLFIYALEIDKTYYNNSINILEMI